MFHVERPDAAGEGGRWRSAAPKSARGSVDLAPFATESGRRPPEARWGLLGAAGRGGPDAPAAGGCRRALRPDRALRVPCAPLLSVPPVRSTAARRPRAPRRRAVPPQRGFSGAARGPAVDSTRTARPRRSSHPPGLPGGCFSGHSVARQYNAWHQQPRRGGAATNSTGPRRRGGARERSAVITPREPRSGAAGDGADPPARADRFGWRRAAGDPRFARRWSPVGDPACCRSRPLGRGAVAGRARRESVEAHAPGVPTATASGQAGPPVGAGLRRLRSSSAASASFHVELHRRGAPIRLRGLPKPEPWRAQERRRVRGSRRGADLADALATGTTALDSE